MTRGRERGLDLVLQTNMMPMGETCKQTDAFSTGEDMKKCT